MKLTGDAVLHATPERVYAALNDPAVLSRAIPGCQQLEPAGADRYRMTITAGVASIKGSYAGEVELADPQPPTSFTLRASGSGAPGTVRADVRVALTGRGDGTTQLHYDADAVVGGPVGGVGQRVLGGVARRTAQEFFTAVDGLISAEGAKVPSPARPEPTPGTVPAVPPSTSPPSTGPSPTPSTAQPQVPHQAGNRVHVDVRDQLPGAIAGALIALAGVMLGARLARRRR